MFSKSAILFYIYICSRVTWRSLLQLLIFATRLVTVLNMGVTYFHKTYVFDDFKWLEEYLLRQLKSLPFNYISTKTFCSFSSCSTVSQLELTFRRQRVLSSNYVLYQVFQCPSDIVLLHNNRQLILLECFYMFDLPWVRCSARGGPLPCRVSILCIGYYLCKGLAAPSQSFINFTW